MKKYIVPLLLILFIGCKKSKNSQRTYFGGKIINPKDNFVILFNYKGVIDSLPLTKDNTFLGTFDSIQEGLYYFKHGLEHQYVYLEPNDSLLLRLNTWDFDESLVFSGKNAARNNILIETFLQNEREEKAFYTVYDVDAVTFNQKIDSLKVLKKKQLKRYITENNETSATFLSLLQMALNYPIATKLEHYVINNNLRSKPQKLAATFLKHRINMSINTDSLLFFYPYNDYLITSLYNDIYQKGLKKDSDAFTIELLKNINTKIESEELRNKLLYQTTIKHFYNKSSCKLNTKVFYTFFKFNSNIDDKKKIQRLLNDTKQVQKNKKLPSFTLVNASGIQKEITEYIKNKKTAIYFKNSEFASDEWVASRINLLMNKNPAVNFIIVNLNDDKDHYIKKIDIQKQYHLNEKSAAHNFLTSKFPRIILINKKGIVENGFGAISTKKIAQQINDL